MKASSEVTALAEKLGISRDKAWNRLNKPKRAAANRRWYLKNKKEVAKYQRGYIARKHQRFLEWKSKQKCSRCPENHPSCLEFHHRDPSKKDFNISQGWRLNYSWDRLMLEIEKCEILCANCHRKIHWKLGNNLCFKDEFQKNDRRGIVDQFWR